MGSWGTALYSNDTSSDVRDMCNEVYPLVGIEEGTKLILNEYADIIDGNMIDLDTSFFVVGRHPQWSFTDRFITNYFGFEEKCVFK